MIQQRWKSYLTEKLSEALEYNQEAVAAISTVIAERHLAGKNIWAFGSGHSRLLVEEMYFRAGGLTIVRPIWDEALMLHRDPVHASALERTPDYHTHVIEGLDWGPGDVLWLISNSGRNWLIVEMALEARRRGLSVVALTSVQHSKSVAPAGRNMPKLYEIADWTLDNRVPVGDAGLKIRGLDAAVGPSSTVIGAALVQAVWVGVAEILTRRGHAPEVYTSFNVDVSGRRNA